MPFPAFVPTENDRLLVARCAGYGLTEGQIRQLIINPVTQRPISENILRRVFRPELDSGLVQTIHNVAGALVRQALRGNVAAQIFYLKTRAGWKETVVLERVRPLSEMSSEEIRARLEIDDPAKNGNGHNGNGNGNGNVVHFPR